MPDDPTLNPNSQTPAAAGNSSNGQSSNEDVALPTFMTVANSGASGAPPSGGSNDFFPPAKISEPKKKFGSGKIIATILGVLLLVGGIASGIILVLQPQLLQQKALTTTYHCPSGTSGYVCNDCGGHSFCNTDTTITCDNWRQLNCAGGTPNDPHGYCGGCPNGTWCDSGTRQCLSTGGTGNCSTNTGDCYVLSGIGVGPDGKICSPGGHWTTCAAGYTCSNHDCVPISPPRTPPPPTRPPTTPPPPTRTPTPTPTPTRTPTPTPTRTPTPTPTPVPKCNSTCTTNANCLSGMVCYKTGTSTSGFCRNPSCTGQTNCVCSTPTPTPTPTPRPTPTPPGPNAVCSSVKAYDSGWSQLSQTQLSNLKPGNNIMFCVAGTASSGAFDKGKFTINSVVQAETTTKRPNSNDYCQSYTIPSGVTRFTITAQVHHVTLGWVGP